MREVSDAKVSYGYLDAIPNLKETSQAKTETSPILVVIKGTCNKTDWGKFSLD